jgi:hypothetical protein
MRCKDAGRFSQVERGVGNFLFFGPWRCGERQICHRGTETQREAKDLTQSAQRKGGGHRESQRRVGDAVDVVASWGAASSAPAAYCRNCGCDRWRSEDRRYKFNCSDAGLPSQNHSGQAGGRFSSDRQGRAAQARPSGPGPVGILPETSSVCRSMTATALSPARAT